MFSQRTAIFVAPEVIYTSGEETSAAEKEIKLGVFVEELWRRGSCVAVCCIKTANTVASNGTGRMARGICIVEKKAV